ARPGHLGHRLERGRIARTELRAPYLERGLENAARFRAETQDSVGDSHRVHELRAHQGLDRSVVLDSRRALVEKIPRGHGPALGTGGVRGLEEIRQELRDVLRAVA